MDTCVKKMFDSFVADRGFQEIPPFELHELEFVLKQMRCVTAADADGFVVDMFRQRTVDLQMGSVSIFHDMLRVRILESK